MNEYWQNLNERERKMVLAAGVAMIIYLFYLLIYAPLTGAVSTRQQDLKEKRETLQWLQTVQSQALKSMAARSPISENKLLSLITAQLNRPPFKSYPYQLQQTGANEIQITFEQVPFNPFIRWLWGLSSRYKMTLKQLSVSKTPTPGVTKLTVLFSVG